MSRDEATIKAARKVGALIWVWTLNKLPGINYQDRDVVVRIMQTLLVLDIEI